MSVFPGRSYLRGRALNIWMVIRQRAETGRYRGVYSITVTPWKLPRLCATYVSRVLSVIQAIVGLEKMKPRTRNRLRAGIAVARNLFTWEIASSLSARGSGI